MGVLEFVGRMRDTGEIIHERDNGRVVAMTNLKFEPGGELTVSEDDILGQYGAGVTFTGRYRRAG